MRTHSAIVLCGVVSFFPLGVEGSASTVHTRVLSKGNDFTGQETIIRNLGKLTETIRDGKHLQHSHRHLQSAITRSCDEVIGVTPVEVLTPILTAYVDIMIPSTTDPDTNAMLKQAVTTSAKHDIVATKICASCAQVMGMYGNDSLLADDSPNGFATYCGPDKFGHDAVVSGLMWQPYNATDDSFVPGIFKGAITGKQSNSSSFFTATERWPSDFVADFLSTAPTQEESSSLILANLDMLVPAYAASTGIISIFPDYVGYGEDFQGTKSNGAKRAYQLSTVSLWLAAKKKVMKTTKGCSGLQDKISMLGYSEGAYSVVASGAALYALDVEILDVFAGGGPYRPATAMSTFIGGIEDGTVDLDFLFALALNGHGYSSTNPDQANTGTGQDLLSEAWKDVVTGWIDDGIPGYIVNTLMPSDDPLSIVNEDVVQAISTARNESLVC